MRVALLSAASAAVLMACAIPAALADSDFSGVGQVYVGRGQTDGGFFIGKALDDPFSYGATGKGYWPLSPDVHFQADIFAQHDDDMARNFGDHSSTTTFGGAIHLLHPFENRARFGLAGSVWSNDVFTPAGSGRTEASYGLAALEAQIFGSDWTVMGQAGAFTDFDCGANGGEGCPGIYDGGTYVRGKVRYFLHDNTVLSLETTRMWGTLRDDGIFSGKSITCDFEQWVLDAEHRFEDSQFSLGLALTHEHQENFLSVDTDSAMLSLKFYYNQPTLRANDKSGAELDTPQFGHAIERAGIMAEGII